MDKKAKCTVSLIEDDLGDEDAAFKISTIMNSRAPLTIRVNPLKIRKHEVQSRRFSWFKNLKNKLNQDFKNASMPPSASK